MRAIAVVTAGRSDFGIYRSLLDTISADSEMGLHLIATGTHLSPEFGATVTMIEREGFALAERIEMLLSSDSPEGIAKSMALGVLGFGQLFGRWRPDLLVALGDRFEMAAAVLAALPFKIPVAHIHGGELTEGAIDDALRHSMTKLSHLHFVTTDEYARRVLQLGEEPWRVTVCGAPALDRLDRGDWMSREDLEAEFGLSLERRPLLVTFHPATLEYEQAEAQTAELLAALEASGLPIVFTAPNADTAGRKVRTAIRAFVEAHADAGFVENFGQRGYFSMMQCALAMVGNSSSGIIEAASFALPVVNIGSRQAGRVCGGNVLHASGARDEILATIRQAVAEPFRSSLKGLPNVYRAGNRSAASIIAERLKNVPLNGALLTKRFNDLN